MARSRDLTGDPDPRAAPRAVVVADRVRVTVLTDRLVRLEFAADGQFEDRATLSVVNRRFPLVPFEVRTRGTGIQVDTGAMKVDLTDTGRAFSRSTLGARIGRGARAVEWRHGARDTANLGGTRRTLDGWKGRQRQRVTGFDARHRRVEFGDWETQHLDPGLLSRSGWTVIDESTSVVLEPRDPGRTWPVPRDPGRRQDLYLFGYGADHKGALGAASRLLGPQPLPPRYAFGYWYSRYYAYTDRELDDLAERFDQMGVPLDVLVVDMDWHLPGWTGYSWDRRYFPDPDDTLARLHDRGLRVTLNLHPADGIGSHEDAFEPMCAALGLDPATTDRIPFDCTDPTFVASYFRLLHHPDEDRGVDFWWMDWQQGRRSAIEGLDPLPWLNQLHWDDQARRRGRRPLVFSRWGGLGGGRYPIGFSGDAWSVWESLAFQPEFTATAANVLYGYWSHDIGGHYGPATTPELYTRWVQFGAYSPILRTHGSKHPEQERRFWEFDDPYRTAMIEAVKRRYELVPYVYSECRRGMDSGLSLVRPMYHENPEVDAAYEAPGQYHFGDHLVVAPVVTPVDEVDDMAGVRVWLPRGRWYDTALGQMIVVRSREGEWFDRRYFIDEIPVFAPGGTVVPGQLGARRAGGATYDHLLVTGYPGGDGRYDLYEDDGISQGYLRGDAVSLPLDQRITTRTRSIRVGPARGGYRGWARRRPVQLRFVSEAPPTRVTVGEREVRFAPAADGGRPGAGSGYWWYDTASASVVVCLPAIDLRTAVTVRLTRDPALPAGVGRRLDGYPGLARRLDAIAYRTGLVSPHYELHPEERLAVDLAQAGNRVTRDPSTLGAELRRVRREVARLDRVLAEFQEAWRAAMVVPFADPREMSVALLQEARGILATTVRQFG